MCPQLCISETSALLASPSALPCVAADSMKAPISLALCSIVYMVGTDEESFEWLDVNKVPEEVRISQDTVNVLDLPRPPEVKIVQCLFPSACQC